MSIYTLPISELIDKLTELLSKLESVGSKYAESRAHKEAMEDQEKPFKAVIMEEHEGSQSYKESKALADKRYIQFLSDLTKKRLDFYMAQSEYESVKTKIECLRTIISTRKEEINKFGG